MVESELGVDVVSELAEELEPELEELAGKLEAHGVGIAGKSLMPWSEMTELISGSTTPL